MRWSIALHSCGIMLIMKRSVDTLSPSIVVRRSSTLYVTSSLYIGVSVTIEGARATGAPLVSWGSVKDSRKNRRTSLASALEGSAAGLDVDRATKTCSTAVRPGRVASAGATKFLA